MNALVDAIVKIKTRYGPSEAITFTGLDDAKEHIAFGYGDWRGDICNVRIHSECLTGDVFGSMRCDCGPQLEDAMRGFSRTGGLIIYLRQEGRGIGLLNKMRAYRLQDEGLDTYEANHRLGFGADTRDFDVAAAMLHALEIHRVRLLSNNPRKAESLIKNGIDVVDRVFTRTHLDSENERYLQAKRDKGGHDGLTLPKVLK